MNKNAIIVYVDNNPKLVEEFSWLWKSWLMWDIDKEWDLISFCHPEIEDQLKENFQHESCKIVPQVPLSETDDFWKEYSFVNSFSYFNNEDNIELVSQYDFILKTDCDTFLTKYFKGFKPWKDRVYIGNGAQYGNGYDSKAKQAIHDRLRLYSNQFNLNSNMITHVGASLLASTQAVILITKMQLRMTKIIMSTGFPKGSNGHWPGWFKGVSSMYAGELALNNFIVPDQIHQGSLDVWCTQNEITSLDIHIHAWQHNLPMFNKAKYHAGDSPVLKFSKVPVIAGEYCQWVASTDLDTLKVIAQKV